MTYNPHLIAKIDPTPGAYINPHDWPAFVAAVKLEGSKPGAYSGLAELPAFNLKKTLWRSAVQGVYAEEDVFRYGKELAEKASWHVLDAILCSTDDADAIEIQYRAVTPCILAGDEDSRTVIERFMEPMIQGHFQRQWEG